MAKSSLNAVDDVHKALFTLLDISFINSPNNSSFSAYNYTLSVCLDVLADQSKPYPQEIVSKLFHRIQNKKQTSPASANVPIHFLPTTPEDQINAMFLFNVIETTAHELPPTMTRDQILPFIVTLLKAPDQLGHDSRELYEAAHASTLAILSNEKLLGTAVVFIPEYEALVLEAFPEYISERQVRLVFQSLVRTVVSLSPGDLGLSKDVLQTLEMKIAMTTLPIEHRTSLLLALIDCVPSIQSEQLYPLLDRIDYLINAGCGNKEATSARLWEVISKELDPARAHIAVKWWTVRNQGVCAVAKL